MTFPDARTASHEYLEGKLTERWSPGFGSPGRGKRTSGVESEMEIWQVWEIRDQDNMAVTRVTEFTNRREAVEAAGVSE